MASKRLDSLSDEQRFELLLNAVRDYAIYLLDTDGVVATWNAGAQRFKGYTADEIIGQSFSMFFTPADQEAGLPQTDALHPDILTRPETHALACYARDTRGRAGSLMAANRRAGDSSAQASERHMGEPAPALDCVSKCWSASNNVGRKPLSRSPARDG